MSDETPEEWRPVVGWEGLYEVSSHGRIKSLERIIHEVSGKKRVKREKILSSWKFQAGYPGTHFNLSGKTDTRTIHQVMAEAFIPNPDNHPVVRHLNDVKDDNRLENLAWGTHSDNMYDSVRNGTANNGNTFKTVCVRGHDLMGDGVRIGTRGQRVCIPCERINFRETRERLSKRGLAPDDERHGTPTGYSLWMCKCKPCRESKRSQDRKSAERRKAQGLPDGDSRHGTPGGYSTWYCRCSDCTRANTLKKREEKIRYDKS